MLLHFQNNVVFYYFIINIFLLTNYSSNFMGTIFLFQSLGDILDTFIRNIRIIDIFDIALISLFLYIVLNWLRRSASRRLLISFAIFITLYLVARFSGMYLTERLLEFLF